MALIDDWTDSLARAGGLTPAQAAETVRCTLRFLASRLPSPLFGELQSHLRLTPDPDAPQPGALLPPGH